MNRLKKPIWMFTAPAPAEGGDGEPGGEPKGGDDQTFKQADVDRIVTERLKREREATKAKYADYDDLKAKAEGAKTVEDQLAELRGELAATKIEAARASVAARFGISTERGKDGSPSDADLFLTGMDEESMTTQAKRLADRESERKSKNNVSPREGTNPTPDGDDGMREFTRNLFASTE